MAINDEQLRGRLIEADSRLERHAGLESARRNSGLTTDLQRYLETGIALD